MKNKITIFLDSSSSWSIYAPLLGTGFLLYWEGGCSSHANSLRIWNITNSIKLTHYFCPSFFTTFLKDSRPVLERSFMSNHLILRINRSRYLSYCYNSCATLLYSSINKEHQSSLGTNLAPALHGQTQAQNASIRYNISHLFKALFS